ncbi:MAG: FeoB-associated Cys-rich membrane protein [Gemmataceae bacterium]|nr:FeoB-associated Cys-rich membrane protein [Gemmata sp.]MDW8198931.1 FeoB-associated Cys-rich membrane protein [Gemmataceae bacterium]
MPMMMQWIAVGLIVAVAGSYVVYVTYRSWFAPPKAGCGGRCGQCHQPRIDSPPPHGRRPLPLA